MAEVYHNLPSPAQEGLARVSDQPELPIEMELPGITETRQVIGFGAIRSVSSRIGMRLPDDFDPRRDNAWNDLGGNTSEDKPAQWHPRVGFKTGKPQATPRRRTFESASASTVEIEANSMMEEFTFTNKRNPTDEEMIDIYHRATRKLRNPRS